MGGNQNQYNNPENKEPSPDGNIDLIKEEMKKYLKIKKQKKPLKTKEI